MYQSEYHVNMRVHVHSEYHVSMRVDVHSEYHFRCGCVTCVVWGEVGTSYSLGMPSPWGPKINKDVSIEVDENDYIMVKSRVIKMDMYVPNVSGGDGEEEVISCKEEVGKVFIYSLVWRSGGMGT